MKTSFSRNVLNQYRCVGFLTLLLCLFASGTIYADEVQVGTVTIKIVRDEKRYVPARVHVDGVFRGWAPLTLDLSAGVHELLLEDPTGHRTNRNVRLRVVPKVHVDRFFRLPVNKEGQLYRQAARDKQAGIEYRRLMKQRRSKRQQGNVQYVVGGKGLLEDIAEAFRTTVDKLRSLNPGVEDHLRPGTRIWLPQKLARRAPKTSIRGRVVSAPAAQLYSPLRGLNEAAESCATQGSVQIIKREHRLFYKKVRGARALPVVAAQFGDVEADLRRRNRIEGKRALKGWGLLVNGRADSISGRARGSSTKGRLINGEQMPPGIGHVVRYPKHAFGTSRVVDLLYSVFEDLRRCDPDMPPIVVGDLSRAKGGAFPPHKSHQNGRDVDLSYVPALQMHVGRGFMADRTSMDVPRTWTFLKRLIDTEQIEFLFVDRSVQKLLYDYVKSTMSPEKLRRLFQYPSRGFRGVIRHAKGHVDHVHVRFKKPVSLREGTFFREGPL